MSRFTKEDRAFCIQAFFRNGDSATLARREFMNHRGLHKFEKCPSVQNIRYWAKMFRATSSTERSPYKQRRKPARTPEKIDAVRTLIHMDPRLSGRRIASSVRTSHKTTQRILIMDLGLHPYKFQMVQELQPGDFEKRLEFAKVMLKQFDNFNNILFTDEAHFHLSGPLNRQNYRFYSEENPRNILETGLHPKKCTAWVGLASWGVIGPFFFEDDGGKTTIVDSDGYLQMLRGYLTTELQKQQGHNRRTWFQQDGAPPHRTKRVMEHLQQMFPQRVISLGGDITWPPRSPDLNPLDFFLWGYLKSKVYNNNPTTIDQLKANIQTEIDGISNVMLKRVCLNFEKRLKECKKRKGHHLEDVIFKK